MQSLGDTLLIGGTNEGEVGLIEFTEGVTPSQNWRVKSLLYGHEGIVRSALWDQNAGFPLFALRIFWLIILTERCRRDRWRRL
jgi:hypothetical protein